MYRVISLLTAALLSSSIVSAEVLEFWQHPQAPQTYIQIEGRNPDPNRCIYRATYNKVKSCMERSKDDYSSMQVAVATYSFQPLYGQLQVRQAFACFECIK
jgi:hypothetical protein